MSTQQNQIRISAIAEEIARAGEFVAEVGLRIGLTERARHHCRLAVDEACTNIIEHGYGGDDPNQFIDVRCVAERNALRILVVDDGPAFNPLNQPMPDPLELLEERGTGGWGVFFIKRLMDGVAYEFHDGRNHLIMIKSLLGKTD
jgi:anti-sigma regulatory factor (Ser/Thr protein kinase)